MKKLISFSLMITPLINAFDPAVALKIHQHHERQNVLWSCKSLDSDNENELWKRIQNDNLSVGHKEDQSKVTAIFFVPESLPGPRSHADLLPFTPPPNSLKRRDKAAPSILDLVAKNTNFRRKLSSLSEEKEKTPPKITHRRHTVGNVPTQRIRHSLMTKVWQKITYRYW